MTPALFLVAAGLGTVIRWRCGSRPLGILAVNVVGAFLLGLLTGSSPDTVLVGGLAGVRGEFAVALGKHRELTGIEPQARALGAALDDDAAALHHQPIARMRATLSRADPVVAA